MTFQQREPTAYEVAARLSQVHISVIPVRGDGSKAAAIPWKPFQSRVMTEDEIGEHFTEGRGVAIVAGAISGGLEILDIESRAPFDKLCALIESRAPGLLKGLPHILTPSGGHHFVYRCSVISRNQKLAMEAGSEGKPFVVIETRGEGGYAATIGSPGACHPTGRCYKLLWGRLTETPTITPEEREILLACCRSFNAYVRPENIPSVQGDQNVCSSSIIGLRPGDDYNRRGDALSLLIAKGWEAVSSLNGTTYLRRPGKTGNGISATFGHVAPKILYVFSSNASPFNFERAYDSFGIYTMLECGGNPTEAARRLAKEGYGVQRGSTVSQTNHQSNQMGAENCVANDTGGWTDPLPLIAKVESADYPVDALPEGVRSAAEEVRSFIKAPIALVASCALSALSVVTQAHVDVERAAKLKGPVSLFTLTIADSGERKTTCDGFFTGAIRNYEKEQAERARPTLKQYSADCASWTAEQDGILAKIKQEARGGKPVDSHRERLAELEERKPKGVRVPSFLRGDDTPENLTWVLSQEWPSAAVLTSEAGIILGSHGMGSESIMRNLALLNILWDGGTLKVGRRTSGSFTVHSARLTLGLQIQEQTLRAFFDKSGKLARGIGFFARFLVSWPESTQGFRAFTEPPPSWPAIASFNTRVSEILNWPVTLDADGVLVPATLALTPDAKALWIAFHDGIEGELRSGGELADVRDVASKIADNASRLSAVFHVFEHGIDSSICAQCFEGASRVAAWHLNESRRFFGELAFPDEVANAARLDEWLIKYCRSNSVALVSRREVQRCGPNRLRGQKPLEATLRELVKSHRVRLKGKDILVNPRLLEGGKS